MITVVFFPNENWKHCGIVRHKFSRSGHLINEESLMSITVIHAWKTLETVGTDTLKR